MYFWIIPAAVAQLINAAIVLVDKYLLSSGELSTPSVYAFYVSLLSGVVIVLVPFGLISVPSWAVIGLSLAMAATYIFSILLLYSALKVAEASDVVPVSGAMAALTTFAFGMLLSGQALPQSFTLAFVLLVIGTLLISHFRFNSKSLYLVILSGVLFGVSSLLVKQIFLRTTFIDGFFWSRMANVLGAFLLLLWPGNVKAIKAGFKRSSGGFKGLLIANKAMSGVAFALTLLAIQTGIVPVVNALAGLQFAFLLTFAYFGATRFPRIFHGEIHPHKFQHKLYGVIFLVFGFLALFLSTN